MQKGIERVLVSKEEIEKICPYKGIFNFELRLMVNSFINSPTKTGTKVCLLSPEI